MERMVARGSEEEEVEGGSREVLEEKGGAAEEAGVVGELRLDEEGEDLAVPLACVWI